MSSPPKIHLKSPGSGDGRLPTPAGQEAPPIRRTEYQHSRLRLPRLGSRTGRASRGSGRPRRRLGWVGVLLLLPVVVVAGLLLYGWVQWEAVPRAEQLTAMPAPAASEAILFVGSDTRAGLSDSESFGGESVGGQRADTIMLMVLPPGGPATMVSLPRDLKVDTPGRGVGKLNGAFNGGPPMIVAAVQSATGLSVNHYVQVNFDGFQDLATAVGGVPICVDNPAKDTYSGLDLPAGCHDLQGEQALAWVRSRHTQFLVDGKWKSDPRGDLGRIERQQEFMKNLFSKMASFDAVLNFTGLVGAAQRAFVVDPGFSYWHALRLGLRFARSGTDGVQFMTLPVVPKGAFVVRKEPDASNLLGALAKGEVPPVPATSP